MDTTAVNYPNYRVIHAPLVLLELWNHLAQDPSLARHIEVVEIQRLRPATIPPALRPAAQALARTESSTYDVFFKVFVPGVRVRQAEKALIADDGAQVI
jgi:hypothetical protein